VDAAPLLREIRIELGGKSPEAVAQHLHSHRSPPGAAADKGAQKLLAKKRAASAVPRSITSEIQQDVSQLDEAYKLVIPADGSPGTLSANSSLGIFRGLETITQLIYALPGELTTAHYLATRYIWNAPIEINDKPAFPYRGLLLDTSRNFYPTYAIKRVLTVMSFAKLNQFHW
jgi:hexosaminidase